MNKIGLYGIGMVGGALKRYFEKVGGYELFLYDAKNIGSIEEVNKADYIYICLPTPYLPGIGYDTSIIRRAIVTLNGNKVIIIKSTILPGKTDTFQKDFPQHKFLFNPEFLTEATADKDMQFPDRQIIGYTKESESIANEVMEQLPRGLYNMIIEARAAEMIKLGTNTLLAIKNSAINEFYDLSKVLGITTAEWEKISLGISADSRIGPTHMQIIHKSKRGYSGKCLPKDMKALIDFASEKGVDLPVRKATNEYNDKLLNSQGLKTYL